MSAHITYHTEFLTATILNWQKLLEDDIFKRIIVSSLKWLTDEKRCKVYAFVIMPNHIHLLWQICDGVERRHAQGALFSFTAHMFKKQLQASNPALLESHFVSKIDRQYQFWERVPMVKECWTKDFLAQKLQYIHQNPCQSHWDLAAIPEDYYWSSAALYEKNKTVFEWLTIL